MDHATMTPPLSDRPWWHPEAHADRRPLLLARNRIKAALRAWFDAQGSIEVDPAGLQVSPGNETHLHAFATTARDGAGGARTLYLNTSPEFAMKKLLAAGETRLHAFAPVWRNRERGPLHAPEFTMLEWYRAVEPYDRLMDDCAQMLALAARAAGSDSLRWRGATCDPFAAPERVSVADAFARFADVNLMATIRGDGSTDRDALAAQATAAGLRVTDDDTWADILSKVLVARVEPHLGHGRATILDRYPVAEAALARPAPDDPRVAERFELYACGVELANGFGELTDPVEQRRRFTADMDAKERLYGERYPLDEDFLSALSLMPPASGIAMGFDRLVTLATGAPGVEAVMWVGPG
jgi:lysyl-tRNA synthetase class 2